MVIKGITDRKRYFYKSGKPRSVQGEREPERGEWRKSQRARGGGLEGVVDF